MNFFPCVTSQAANEMLHAEIIQMLNRNRGRGSSVEETFTSKSFFEEEIQLFGVILLE